MVQLTMMMLRLAGWASCFFLFFGFSFSGAFAEEGKPWKNESQVSAVKTDGNSESESYSIKQATSYTHSKSTHKINGSYLESSSVNATTGQDEETARKWDLGVRTERVLNDKWMGLLGYLVESDKYAGYQQKHNTDVGAKYIVAKEEHYEVLSEAGFRYIHQNNADGSQNHANAARIYLEGLYKINPTNSTKIWIEHIPNFEESNDYQTNAEASLSSAINTTFSLKVAYLVKSDNLPEPGKEKTDTTFTTALVAKF